MITGFLGAGKTSLIRNLMTRAGGRRIALIINEFGDIGVDGDLLRGCGVETCRDEDIIELANGCICCTVADDFIPTMTKLLDRGAPDHIVIETSGLALPQPLIRAFAWPEIRTRVTVDGVITVVDGPAALAGQFAPGLAADAAMTRRRCPSCSRTNWLAPIWWCCPRPTRWTARGWRRSRICWPNICARPRGCCAPAPPGWAPICCWAWASRPRTMPRGARRITTTTAPATAHDHGHDEFDSFVLDLPELTDAGGLADRLAAVMADQRILRLKGLPPWRASRCGW